MGATKERLNILISRVYLTLSQDPPFSVFHPAIMRASFIRFIMCLEFTRRGVRLVIVFGGAGGFLENVTITIRTINFSAGAG